MNEKTESKSESDLKSEQSQDKDNVQKNLDAEKQQKRKKEMARAQMKSALLMTFGALGVVLGAIAVVFWPPLFMAQLRNMMVLTNESMSYSIWKDVPIPMYLECYMWNITNSEDIIAGKNVKLQFEQIGPFVYREFHKKVDIKWNDNSTVTYYNKRTWFFVPEMSNGSLADNITSINPIVATVAYNMRNHGTFIRMGTNAFLRLYHEHMFLTANVSSWIFDGIDDPVIDFSKNVPNLPIHIPYDRFGWFYTRNESKTFDGLFVMDTGAETFYNLGEVTMWNRSNRTVYRDHCGEVRGSTGELWAPELGQEEITVFAPDICTYLTLAKNSTVYVEGLEGVEYRANTSLFDNGHHYPSMACYCAETRDSNCVPSGALNISLCQHDAPAFVTLPHMHNSDPHYPSKIEGMSPNANHTFRLALEMFTGMPLSVSAQLQVNILVRHVPNITINNVLPDADVLVPMFWFRQELAITPEYASMARFALNMRYGMPYAFYALTAIGVALIASGIYVLINKIVRSPDTMPILADTDAHEELTQ